MDLADRKIVGWALSEDMTTENTIWKAWLEAKKNRNIIDPFILHSDRGVQYACNKITNLFFYNKKIIQSMSRKGNCWDNSRWVDQDTGTVVTRDWKLVAKETRITSEFTTFLKEIR